MDQQTVFSHMKVEFDDTFDNWLRWGQLVEHWVDKRQDRPANVQLLKNRMTAHGITNAEVYGDQNREVKFVEYEDDEPLVMMLPTKKMLAKGKASVHPHAQYPLPVFYDKMYGCKRKVLTDPTEVEELATCRVGEYTINECC